MTNEYRFITHWRLQATVEEVYEVLADPTGFPRWWPDVYLGVKVLAPGDASGVGKRVSLYTKGWLPYRLRWSFVVTRAQRPRGFALSATGDFVGTGAWTFSQDVQFVDIVYDWRVRAEKPLLKYLSFLFKPIFSANHRWAMARGRTRLDEELQRRRARG